MSNYKQDHALAKLIVFFIVVVLLLINRHYHSILLDVCMVGVWLFGVNPIAYVIEEIRGHSHKHDKL